MKFQVAYIPIGVGTFHLESAQEQFDKSVQLIRSLTDDGVYPDKMLLTLDELNSFLNELNPSLIILQNITFANAAYATEVLKRFTCPVLLWTLREPMIDGGRLRLNSLTGAYSAANVMLTFRGKNGFEYVFGSPDEKETAEAILSVIRTAKVKYDVQHLRLAAVGHTPQGFGFGRALDSEMASIFGTTLESIEARELIEMAVSYSAEECSEEFAEADRVLTGLENTPKKNILDFIRLYKAYKEYVKANQIGALASRCWPDFFTSYGTPVCTVLSLLNNNGIAVSCESDTYGALSMYIGTCLTGHPTFFGDPVSMDESENTVTFWHCGMAACSLAREDTGAAVGVHPNRKTGPTMEFGCKACSEVTIFRIGRIPDGTIRFFIAEGASLDKPLQFCGTSVVVRTKSNAKDLVYKSVADGWEPHFVIIYGNVGKELSVLAHMYHAEICLY